MAFNCAQSLKEVSLLDSPVRAFRGHIGVITLQEDSKDEGIVVASEDKERGYFS